MADQLHDITITADDDWPVVVCSCGFTSPPVPDLETAADIYADHAVAIARAPIIEWARDAIDSAPDWSTIDAEAAICDLADLLGIEL